MTKHQTTLEPTARATPLAPDDRRALIIDAVIPLLLERGGAVTTRQIAEAAGIAEGTVFRAFGDKESLLRAAVMRYLDPAPLLTELAAIDPGWPLERKIRAILVALRRRFDGVFRMMSTLREEDRPAPVSLRDDTTRLVAVALGPDQDRLGWGAAEIAHITRLLAFSSSFPQMTQGAELTDDELADFVLHGILGAGRASTDGDTRAR